MSDQSWMERTFGKSWELTLVGFGGVVVGVGCMWLGRWLDSAEITLVGPTIMGLAVAAIAKMARSERQHEHDKERGET